MKQAGNKELLGLMEKCGRFLYHQRGGKRGQGKILKILLTEGEMTQKELQERLGIKPGSMSEILMKLEANGFIFRTKDEDDKRKINLKITTEGTRFFEDKLQKRMEEEKSLFNALSAEEQELLKGLLSKLLTSWEEHFDKTLFESRKECLTRGKD